MANYHLYSCHCCAMQIHLQAPLVTEQVYMSIERYKRANRYIGSRHYSPDIEKLKLILNKLTILLGQGIENKAILQKIPKIVDILMSRNYPQLMNWDGFGKLEPIFVPDHYLIKVPEYTDPSRGQDVMENYSEASRIWPERNEEFRTQRNIIEGGRNRYEGDQVEMKVYKILKEHFEQRGELEFSRVNIDVDLSHLQLILNV